MLDNLKGYNIILASNSPRRRELLAGLGLDFQVRTIDGVDESYPRHLAPTEVARYIACQKAQAYRSTLQPNNLLITADTVVIVGSEILGKPTDADDAARMLRMLSGRTHQVVTGVCLVTSQHHAIFSVSTDVTFKTLSDEEIHYYIDRYRPIDKAGAYGIQEWIGYIGVTAIKGSYYNVMGLPIQRIYNELQGFRKPGQQESQNDRWNRMYREVRNHITQYHRLPSKHHAEDFRMLNWLKYNRKCLAAGTMTEERKVLFMQLQQEAEAYLRVNQYGYVGKKK